MPIGSTGGYVGGGKVGLRGLAGQIKGIRGADSSVRTLKDVGEYDVWSSMLVLAAQAGETQVFSYGVGGTVSNSALAANKLDTNMRTPNQFVDESMNVYALGIQVMRQTPVAYSVGGAVYNVISTDLSNFEANTLFRFHVGGDKPFAEGFVTWFSEGGGWAGADTNFASALYSNGVPSIHAARKWQEPLPIGRVEKFWGEYSWPRNALGLGENLMVVTRLLGVRARGVQ
jgi:hypothetical protein